MQESILHVKDLCTHLQLEQGVVTVVDNLSFDLYSGKTLALVGESGSGKSMTALSLLRILPEPPALASTGKVIYRGNNLLTLSQAHMRQIRGGQIAMIFQDPTSSLNPVYTVGNQLMEVAELHLGLDGDAAVERCIKSLTEVGISSPMSRFNDYPHQMSGGMRQRVMIAMALMCEPDILIADEPTTALDVTIQAQVLDLMRELQEKKGMAILLITHDMGVVAEMADEVIVMYAAQAVERGSVLDIFDHRSHPYTQGLFSSRTDLNTPRGSLLPIKGSVPSAGNLPKGCRFHPRCPFVMGRCKSGDVPTFKVDSAGKHLSKCLLYDESEESLLKMEEVKS